jgi:hypothetical protein
MAHFAQLDQSDNVTNVVVVDNSILLDDSGTEQEALGVAFLKQTFGADTAWVQTSYSGRIRGRYAGIGMVYDPAADEFTMPETTEPEAAS